jgi:hypothetical protein
MKNAIVSRSNKLCTFSGIGFLTTEYTEVTESWGEEEFHDETLLRVLRDLRG